MVEIRSRWNSSRIWHRRIHPCIDIHKFYCSVELDTFRYCCTDSFRTMDESRPAFRRIFQWNRLGRNICSFRCDLPRKFHHFYTDSFHMATQDLCRNSCQCIVLGSDTHTRLFSICIGRAYMAGSNNDRLVLGWERRDRNCIVPVQEDRIQTKHLQQIFLYYWRSVQAHEVDIRNTVDPKSKLLLHSWCLDRWENHDCRLNLQQQLSSCQ